MVEIENLIGNQEGSLDHYLLHSKEHTQEERELIMGTVYAYLKQKFLGNG